MMSSPPGRPRERTRLSSAPGVVGSRPTFDAEARQVREPATVSLCPNDFVPVGNCMAIFIDPSLIINLFKLCTFKLLQT